MHIKKGYKELLAAANAEIETLPVEAAIELVGKPEVLFVDLRDPREMEREGRMPGAFACTRGMLEFWIDPESPYAKPVFAESKRFVFFCAGGWRSALAAKTAQDMGLESVSHIEGGFGAWKKAAVRSRRLNQKCDNQEYDNQVCDPDRSNSAGSHTRCTRHSPLCKSISSLRGST
jgi:rhodanese-related sulfurtransferase